MGCRLGGSRISVFLHPASQGVDRALHAPASTVQDVGVDHRRLQFLVPQELLHGPYIIASYQ